MNDGQPYSNYYSDIFCNNTLDNVSLEHWSNVVIKCRSHRWALSHV